MSKLDATLDQNTLAADVTNLRADALMETAAPETELLVLALDDVSADFETAANFTDRGDSAGGAGSDVVYKVNGDAGYELEIDGATAAVYSVDDASDDHVTVSAGKNETELAITFSGGNVFTPASLVVDDLASNSQTLTFEGFAGDTPVGTADVVLDSSGAHKVSFGPSFADVTKIVVTGSAATLDSFTLDDFAFSSVQPVDVTPSVVSSVSSTTVDNNYKTGDVISIQVKFDESVTVTGTPQLSLETGATDRAVDYKSGSGTDTLTFEYTVQAGDASVDLDYTGTDALMLNGGTIKDAAGNVATLTLAEPGAANSLGANSALVINADSEAPDVTGVTSTAVDGSFVAGQVVTIQVNFDEAVTVTGTPQLTLETGATDRVIDYKSGSGTTTLTFEYTIQTGDDTGDLDYASTTALALNGGTIKDGDGKDATLTLAAPGTAGSLGASKAIVIDGGLPAVSSVTSTTADGAYGVGDAISIQVKFDENVTVSGTPQLTLETGAVDRVVDYKSGSGTDTLTFEYTVQAGDNSNDLDYAGTGALALNGGSIKDADGNDAALLLATAGDTNSLGAGKALVIDSEAPAAPAAPDLSDSSDTGTSQTDNITDLTTPTFAGTAEANATVTLYDTDGTTALGTASADGAGKWSITSSTLSAGEHSVTVKAADAAGNTSAASPALAVTISAPSQGGDTTIATAAFSADTGLSTTDFITNTAAQTISGTTSAALAAGQDVEVSLDNGATWTKATSTTGQSTWSLAGVTLTGSNTLQARVIDGSGAGAVFTQAYVLDTSPPALDASTSSPADGSTSHGLQDPVVVGFSDPLSSASTLSGVELRDVATGTLVPSSASIDSSGRLVITPSAPLAASTEYFVSWPADALVNVAGSSHAGIPVTDMATLNFTTSETGTNPGPGDGDTIDGANVEETTTTAPDGTVTTVVTIDPVAAGRPEDPDSANEGLADVPVVEDAEGNVLLGVGLPENVGVTVEGVSESDATIETLLGDAAETVVSSGEDLAAIVDTGFGEFLPSITDPEQVTLRTISFEGATPPVDAPPLLITGSDNAETQEILVIDASSLPADTTLQLDHVEFAVVAGAAEIVGGAGDNYVVGDSAEQFMVLGEGDDVLRGGGGNDTVASMAGEDQLYGDEGDDLVVGGTDDDVLEGGAGNDVLQGGRSDAGTWSIQLNASDELESVFTARESRLTDTASFTKVGAWVSGGSATGSDDRVAYSFQDADRLETVSLLFQTAVGRLPTLAEMNHYASAPLTEQQLAGAALQRLVTSRPDLANATVETRAQALVESAWGDDPSNAQYASELAADITAGGSWVDNLLEMLRDDRNTHLDTDEEGNLQLVESYVMNESGWQSGNDADVLRGGEGNDRLVGGRGSDELDGGEGIDIAVFSGTVSDYTITRQLEGDQSRIVIAGRGTSEVDTLTGIEYLQVGSRYYDLQEIAQGLSVGATTPLVDVAVEVVGSQLEQQGVTLLV